MASRKTARLPEMFNPDPFAATAVAPAPEPAPASEPEPEPTPAPAPAPELRSIPAPTASDAEDVEEPAVSAATPVAPPGRRRLTPNAALPPRDYAVGGRPPAPDLAHVAPVKITAYVRPDQLEAL